MIALIPEVPVEEDIGGVVNSINECIRQINLRFEQEIYTQSQIAYNAIGTQQLQDKSVTNAKLGLTTFKGPYPSGNTTCTTLADVIVVLKYFNLCV